MVFRYPLYSIFHRSAMDHSTIPPIHSFSSVPLPVRFVIGHEIGHVVKNHVRHKLQLAYGVSAIRKGVAASGSAAGDLARSQLGAFAEVLMNARFSQLEEKAADDYGLLFLLREGYEPGNGLPRCASSPRWGLTIPFSPAIRIRKEGLKGWSCSCRAKISP
jgi:hypothetical protein